MSAWEIFINWLPKFLSFFVPSTALIAVVVWLGRNAILTRLKNSVEYEFNKKLENIKFDLGKSGSESIESISTLEISHTRFRQ